LDVNQELGRLRIVLKVHRPAPRRRRVLSSRGRTLRLLVLLRLPDRDSSRHNNSDKCQHKEHQQAAAEQPRPLSNRRPVVADCCQQHQETIQRNDSSKETIAEAVSNIDCGAIAVGPAQEQLTRLESLIFVRDLLVYIKSAPAP
jgi:hypothetical protein